MSFSKITRFVINSLFICLVLSIFVYGFAVFFSQVSSQPIVTNLCDCCKQALEHTFSNAEIINMAHTSIGWLPVVALVLFVLMVVGYFVKRFRIRGIDMRCPFVIIWSAGFVAYCVGGAIEMNEYDGSFAFISSVVPMAMLHATAMFLGDCDLDAIVDLRSNSLFMTFFGITHLTAVSYTFVLILLQFGFYMVNEMQIWVMSLVYKAMGWFAPASSQKKDLFVMWGVNDKSLQLAKSIRDNDERHRIVFVRTFDGAEERDKHAGFNHIFEMIRMRNDEINKLRKLKCYVKTSFNMLSKAEYDEAIDGNKTVDILNEQLSLNSLTRLMRAMNGDVHFFFLTDDEDLNIKCVNNLVKDKSIHGIKDGRRINIYCHALHSAKTRGMEVEDLSNYNGAIRVRIIDSSQLSIFHLKANVENHPVNFVRVPQGRAIATSEFRAVIVGFGETGHEAFNFLYEFGAFVDKDGKRSPFHCTIIDKKADEIQGLFYAKAPAMQSRNNVDHTFQKCEINSPQYWQILNEEVSKGLNNLFITIDDNDVAIDTAITFCNLATFWKDRGDDKLTVYIRCYSKDNYERMNEAVNKFNNKFGNITIQLFGSIEQLFTYDYIVSNIFEIEAKKYNFAYYAKALPVDYASKSPSQKTQQEIEKCWMTKLRLDSLSPSSTIWDIEDIERMRDQNVRNALHAETKKALLTKAKGMTDQEAKVYWTKLNLEREKGTTVYDELKKNEDKQILLDVARCEHERWVVASMLQGWRQTNEEVLTEDNKDKKRKIHIDMVSWDEIRHNDPNKTQSSTQSYDCDVVDTTIKIWNKEEEE